MSSAFCKFIIYLFTYSTGCSCLRSPLGSCWCLVESWANIAADFSALSLVQFDCCSYCCCCCCCLVLILYLNCYTMIALNLRSPPLPLPFSLPNYKSRLDNQQGIPKRVAHHHVLLYAQTSQQRCCFWIIMPKNNKKNRRKGGEA